MKLKEDLIGKVFGRLTVLSFYGYKTCKSSDRKGLKGLSQYVCLCSCGNKKIVTRNCLITGKTKSCGCLRRETTSKMSKSRRRIPNTLETKRLYNIWKEMKCRCGNIKNKNYKMYGGRGIDVCPEWKKDFMNFYNWAILNGYNSELTLDRIDNNKNYEPLNCRWATYKEQARNRRNTRIIEYQGISLPLSTWCDELSLNYNRVLQRIDAGWSVENAFEKPARYKSKTIALLDYQQ